MGTTQFDNSKLGETLVEKSTVGQTASMQERVKNGNESELGIYLLIFHRSRKHDLRGGRRIGPRESKDFSFPHGGPHRTDHPHERTGDKVERNERRGPPHAREFRHGPHFMYNPEKEFIDERGYVPHRGVRRFGPDPHGDSSRHPHRFGPHEHGHGFRGSPRGRFETERFPYHHLPREHVHGPHFRERGFCPRGKFEVEENMKRFNSYKNPQSHRHSHRPHGKLHDPRERFESKENLKEFHGKHRHHGGPPPLGQRSERGPHDGSPSREHRHSPRGRFEKELRYLVDHLGHHGCDRKFKRSRHEPEPDYESDHSNRSFRRRRSSRKFEHGGYRSESECESDYSSKSFEHYRDGHRFEHHKRGIHRNHHDGFDSRGERRLRSGPRLHRHAHRTRHDIFRRHLFPLPPHYSKPLTPEELAEKVALLNSMCFTSENNSYYEELLRKFNGRIGHVVDTLLKEQKREKDDKSKEKNDEKGEDNEKEKHSENKEDYDIIEEASEQF